MPYRFMEPRFPLGEVFASAGAAADPPPSPLRRLGDLGEGDKQANEEAPTLCDGMSHFFDGAKKG